MMKNKKKTFILVLVLAVVLFGAWVAYGKLKDQVTLPDALVSVENVNTATERIAERTTPETDTTEMEQTETVSESTTGNDLETEQPDRHPAVAFSFTDREGKERNLTEFIGNPIFLSFWASWCTYCKMQMPAVQAAYDKYGDEIVFLMMNVTDGRNETVEKAAALIDGKGYSFPIYFDTDQIGQYTYNVNSLPASYIINAEGNIVGYAKSTLSEEVLMQALERTLSGDY